MAENTTELISKLFSISGISELLYFTVVNKAPSADEIKFIVSGQQELNYFLFGLVFMVVVTFVALLKNPMHPFFSIVHVLLSFITVKTIEYVLKREAYPWEVGVGNGAAFVLTSLLFREQL